MNGKDHLILFILLILLLTSLLSTPLTYAKVTSVKVYPEKPVQGDVVRIVIEADPNKEIPITILFTKTLHVVNNKYEWRISGVKIPQTPNSFTIKAVNVKNLHVAVKILFWISKSTKAKDGVAIISQNNIPPGTYDTIIHGDAIEDTSTVTVHIKASTKIKTNSEGLYVFSYDTSPIPPGVFTIKVGEIVRTIKLNEEVSYPTPPIGGGEGGVLPPEPTKQKLAKFEVGSIKLNVEEVKIGEPVKVIVPVKNIGEKEGNYTLKLFLDGELKKVKRITLKGGFSTLLEFILVMEKAKVYTIQIDGRTKTFRVKPELYLPLTQKQFKLKNLTNKTHEEVRVGEAFLLINEIFNNASINQKMIYIVQIKDWRGKVVYLNFIEGEIPPKTVKQFKQLWMPEKHGTYKIEAYVWRSWEKPRPLSEPISRLITVVE